MMPQTPVNPSSYDVGRVKILQVNLNHCRLAQDILQQNSQAFEADIAVISEPWRCSSSWFSDPSGVSAIIVVSAISRFRLVKLLSSGPGFVSVDFGDFILFSVYISPNIPMAEYDGILSDLAGRVLEHGSRRCVLMGDFNAKSPLWGSDKTDPRGVSVVDLMGRLDLIPVRSEGSFTFERNGHRSLIDIVLLGSGVRCSSSRILDTYSASDHRYVLHCLGHSTVPPPPLRLIFDGGHFKRQYRSLSSLANPMAICDRGDVDLYIDLLRRLFRSSCHEVDRHLSNRRGVWWWGPRVARKRQNVIKSRRRYQRARARGLPDLPSLLLDFRHARQKLKYAIKDAKERTWAKFLEAIDADPWGKPYKWVLRTLRGRPPPAKLSDLELSSVISDLFVTSPFSTGDPIPAEGDISPRSELLANTEFHEFTEGEILSAVRAVKRRAPGLDGISREMVHLFASLWVSHLTHLINVCCRLGYFPAAWKRGRVVLIPKKSDDRGVVGWRPLSILSNLAKVFEYALKGRLVASIAPLPNQFGFRQGVGTVEAIEHLLRIWEDAKKTNKHCAAYSLDVRNAFNTVRWPNILRALCRHPVPLPIVNTIVSYLQDRVICYFDSHGFCVDVPIYAGVPQGSVLGPLLWNTQYDELLSLRLPPGVHAIGYADDVAVVASASTTAVLNSRMSCAYSVQARWFEANFFHLAHHKTVAMHLTGRKKGLVAFRPILGPATNATGRSLRYLGVLLEPNTTFRLHVRDACNRALRIAGVLARIMPNLGGGSFKSRLLYTRVCESVVLYASPLWASSVHISFNTKAINALQRVTLGRLVRAYRTVSVDALCVLSGVIPLTILVDERRRVYLQTKLIPLAIDNRHSLVKAIKVAERSESLRIWQANWVASKVGRYTFSHLPSIQEWFDWGPPLLDFYLTQALTGHGCFGDFLFRIGRAETPKCIMCEAEDSVSHTLNDCPAWEANREVFSSICGTPFHLERLVPLLREDLSRPAVSSYIRSVLKKKEAAENALQRRRRRR